MFLDKLLSPETPPVDKLVAADILLLDAEASGLLEQQEQVAMRAALVLGAGRQVRGQGGAGAGNVGGGTAGNVDHDPVAPVAEFGVVRCGRVWVDEEECEGLG